MTRFTVCAVWVLIGAVVAFYFATAAVRRGDGFLWVVAVGLLGLGVAAARSSYREMGGCRVR